MHELIDCPVHFGNKNQCIFPRTGYCAKPKPKPKPKPKALDQSLIEPATMAGHTRCHGINFE